jgi:hypothetical protein
MWLLQFPLVLGDQTSNPEFLSDLFFNFLKVLFIIAGVLYLAFAIVVIRQIKIMQESLVTTLAVPLRILGFIHLVLAILVLAYFILVL